ncbi:MAG: efflux RND transporter periplasmic adaptor subunit [Acidobacteria bacterium]|nr:efflux RND transporter periplasmic adaptor subunit [Acidobacteriota bacterium]
MSSLEVLFTGSSNGSQPGLERRPFDPLVRLAVLALVGGQLSACDARGPELPLIETSTVVRRDITYSAIADGVVEPILTVEVKSKASGEITVLAVDTGHEVKAGDVLVRIDPLDAQNASAQAGADLEATVARQRFAESALRRAEQLREENMLPEADYDLAVYEARQAQADAVKARITLDLAHRRLEETTVRAPISGTILTKNVEVGNVIASAVTQVSGGTILMTMADLSSVEIRSFVDEVDVGRVAASMPVRITVEAYPGREYQGVVDRIEPQAIVEQNVTLFPVLVRMKNQDRSLRPGMNVEAEIMLARRDDVISVPMEAIRSVDDIELAAQFLGLSPSSLDGNGMSESPGSTNHNPSSSNGRRAIAFVNTTGGPEIRPVLVGVSDWNHAEVLSGLSEGEEVILLPSSTVLRQQQERLERFRRTRGIPGMNRRSKKKQNRQSN